MNIRCLAVDDEPVALEKLRTYIGRIPYLELAAACEGAFEAMQVLAEQSVDAVFVDINMPDLNGLDFIASLTHPPLVVFTTAYSEYAVDSYRVSAVDYLLKPYGFADFQRAADRLLSRFELLSRNGNPPERGNSLFVKVDYRWIRIAADDIRYIQGYDDYLRIYLCDRPAPLLTYSTFAAILDALPANFLQVHRSYIVNMDRIREVERARIVMDKDTRIPVGASFKERFGDYLKRYSVGKEGKGR